MVANSRTGLQLLLSVVLVVAFHSGAAGAEGPSRAPVGAPRHSSTTMVAPMGPPPRSSTETPAQLAPSPAPAAADDCMNTLLDMSTCLTYVEDGSNLTRPEKGCCQGLSTVVKTNPICLCSLVTKTDIYGVAINRTKSLMLPTVCRVQTPPVSICAMIAGGPAASSPAGAPTGAVPMGPTLPAEPAAPAASPPAGSGADPRFASFSVLLLLAGPQNPLHLHGIKRGIYERG